jgi:formylglycine-generating enzyme required for sulfatase activity
LLLIAIGAAAHAEVTVSNVKAAQRPGTKLVDITYDVISTDSPTVNIYLMIKSGGTPIPATSLSGNVGEGIASGAGRSIVWNAGADWNGNVSANLQASVTADEAQTDLYTVIDLSGGASAIRYPVSTLAGVPVGGWTNAHKTNQLVLRRIPAGTFIMGSPTNELGRASDEWQHEVTLTKDFYIGVFEITQRQWELVMGNKPSFFSNATFYATRPVESVSYETIRGNQDMIGDTTADWPTNANVNASSFMGKLRAKTGLVSIDLPTEARWEFACRAGTTAALNSGKNLTDEAHDANVSEVGRYWYNGGDGLVSPFEVSPNSDLSIGTARVGTYPPNQWGLYDMHGNVDEWCLDWYGGYDLGPVSDPAGSTEPTSLNRVARSGSWFSLAGPCRSASRIQHSAFDAPKFIGLRLSSAPPVHTHTATSANFATDTRDYTLTVASTQSCAPVPGIGAHAVYCWRSIVTPTVDSVTLGYTCSGWIGTGSIPAKGTANTTDPIVLNELVSSITWQWKALTGFELWANGHGLRGKAIELFVQDRNGDGVPNGLEYAFGSNLTPGAPLLTVRWVSGRLVVERLMQDAATQPYINLRVVGSTDLVNWTLPIVPAADTTGKPADRDWFEPQGGWPSRGFFRLEAELIGDYLVIDLSGGASATRYPVSYLFEMPSGGWTDAHKTTHLVLRRIPAGIFIMGSPEDELGRFNIETQHEVTLTKDYYIGVFEVTQRQWELVMGNKPSFFNNATYYATRPVESVSYFDIRENPANSDDPAANWPANSAVNATSFMGKLRARTGLASIDLPTEAQWEYACRAGTATSLNSGKNLVNKYTDANMAEVGRYSENGGFTVDPAIAPSKGTALAGSYLPNQWGLYDMHGNVHEWCLDWHDSYPDAVIDPAGPTNGSSRELRGGSWNNAAMNCRSAQRYSSNPTYRNYYFGLRVCSAPPGQ